MMQRIIHARNIQASTRLVPENLIVIAAPREPSGIQAAKQLADRLLKIDASLAVQILDDPKPAVLYMAQGPVFLLGNLANSSCVKELYYRWLVLTDRWYPGPSGYEVRTLHNPLGSGHNIIHLGYSEESGLLAGLQILLDRLDSAIPRLSEIQATRLPIPAHEAIKFKAHKPYQHEWQVSIRHEDVMKGVLGYLTGDQDCLEEYFRLSEIVVRNGVLTDDKIVQIHLGIRSRVVLFRLLEQTGLLSDSLRQRMAQFIYDWAESDEGYRYIEKPRYISPHFPRQNHGTIPGLALVYAADYFSTHFPGMEEPSVWKGTADRVFAPYTNGSWKPVCDGMCHGWWMTQPTLIDYGLMDREHRFFKNGGAKAAAECAVAIVNNEGWMPNAGDSIILQSFPGPSLRAAAAFYEDPRYAFVHELAPEHRRLYHEWGITGGLRTFDIGLSPAMPEDQTGIAVVPMDPLIYQAWEMEPQLAVDLLDTPPSARIERCFDKLAIRSGWGKHDDYMLIDGLSTKSSSHSYADAMGIHDYARFGVSCIVTEDLLLFPELESHSLVTVVKNGETGPLPCFAEVDEQEKDASGNYYVRLKLGGYAGTDWYREIWLRPGQYAVIHDTVIAREDGDFAVEAHFRTPSRAELNGSVMTSSRVTAEGDPITFRLQSKCSLASKRSLTEVPVSLFYRVHPGEPQPVHDDDDPVVAYKRRYHTDDVALTAFKARCTTRLKPGECVTFTHLAQIAASGEAPCSLLMEEANMTVSCGNEQWHTTSKVRGELKIAGGSASKTGGDNHGDKAKAYLIATQPVLSLPSRITSFKAIDKDGFVCGTDTGAVHRLDADGQVRWTVQLDGIVHDVAAAGSVEEETIFAGHGTDRLTILRKGGSLRKESVIDRDVSPYHWWELVGPTPMRITAHVSDGILGAAVGCGDMQLRSFDKDGTQNWSWWYKEGLPGRILVGDVDGDGIQELIVGGEIITDQSTCRILTLEGKVKAEFPVEGWTSRTSALEWITTGNRSFVACGANRGRNLWVYETSGLQDDPALLENFSNTQHRVRFMERLGGAVTALKFSADGERLAAVTSQGFLCIYDLEGHLTHTRLYENGIAYLGWLNGMYLLVEEDGNLHLVTPDGRSEASLQTGIPSSAFQQFGQELWHVSDNTIYTTSFNNAKQL